jgi:hypothetical protein
MAIRVGTTRQNLADAGTYKFAILCSQQSGPNMIDNCAIASTTFSSAGQIMLTPTFPQS